MFEAIVRLRRAYCITLSVPLLDSLTTIEPITELFVKMGIRACRGLPTDCSTVHRHEPPFEGPEQDLDLGHSFQ